MKADEILVEDVKSILKRVSLEELSGKTILLTGGTGLIGSYLLYSLLEFNKHIENKAIVTVVIHHNIPEWLSFIYTEDWISAIKGDLDDYNFVNSLPNADYIIHAAGYGQPGLFLQNKIKTLRINTQATDILLSKLNKNGKFLYISSSAVYSDSERFPYTEGDYGCTTPQHIRSCYIEGKRCGESICMAYREEGFDVKIGRVSLAYGPCFNRGDKRVLNNFIEKSMQGDIDMLDAGNAMRVYCYVGDTVEMLWDILLFGKAAVYNVGGIEQTSIKGIAEIIASYSGVKIIVPENRAGLVGAPKVEYMDVSKVKHEFKKSVFVSLKEGIERTVDWYNAEYLEG